MRGVLGLAVPALLVLVAVVLIVVIPRGSSSAGDRVAWFESPAADAKVVTGRIPVLAAATDPMGVAVLELYVDGEFVEGRLYEGSPERVEAEFAWLVNMEGSFRLTVRARGTDGLWGVPETIVVAAAHHYRSDEALSPQTTSTTTTTVPRPEPGTTTTAPPQATTTTQAAPCVPEALPVAPPNGAAVDVRPTLEWSYPNTACTSTEQTLHFTGPTRYGPDELWIELPADATAWRPPRLVDCAAYTWTVIARGEDGVGESATWRFTTDFDGEC